MSIRNGFSSISHAWAWPRAWARGVPNRGGRLRDTMDDKIEAAIADLEKGLEEREKGAARAAAGHLYGPHPTLALVKFWQGAVEICIRATIIVSA